MSNENPGGIEAAINNLASAMNEYAGVIKQYAVEIRSAVQAGAGAAATLDKTEKTAEPKAETAAAKKKRLAEEAAAVKEAEEDDGFGEEPETAQEAYTADDVKKKLLEVKAANGGDKTPAIEIIGKHGYAAIPEVQAKDYAAVVKDCDKWIKANA